MSETKCAVCDTRISKVLHGLGWVHVEARQFPYNHDATPALDHGAAPAESARCTECDTRLVDGQCPICCSQKEGSRSGVESAGEPHRNCVLYGSQPAAGDALRHARPLISVDNIDGNWEVYIASDYPLPKVRLYVNTCEQKARGVADAVSRHFAARTVSLEAQLDAMQRTITELQDGLADADRRNCDLAAKLDALKNPEYVARLFHEAYERLAPGFGYKTREASAVSWENVPGNNRELMIATADAVLSEIAKKAGIQ